ncbi:MAG: isopentenyl phosphate kinase [Candidatus Njordarchaeia archaeon]
MKIIKLGGSVITDKNKPLTPREEVIKRIGEELKPAYPDMIITHGTGSFGHHLALKYKIHRGFHGKDEQRIGLGETKYWVNVLTQLIMRSMLDAKIPVFTFFASSLGVMEEGKFVKFDFEPIEGYLKMGVIPLIPADGPVDRKYGALIASGDYLSYLLADHFKADEVIFTIDEDGLIWQNEVLRTLNLDELIEIYNKMEMGKDATGGMKGKLKYVIEILKIGVPVRIVNLTKPNVLKSLLEGGNPTHTYIKP